MVPRTKAVLFVALLLGGVAFIGVSFWGLHQRYVPPKAIEMSRRFISFIESGNLREAYTLTTQDDLSVLPSRHSRPKLRAESIKSYLRLVLRSNGWANEVGFRPTGTAYGAG